MIAAASSLDPNPLDLWASRRLGIEAAGLTHDAIVACQLRALQQTVAWARRGSLFYARHLAALPESWPHSLDDFAAAPLTNQADVAERGHQFLCVPQSEISRIVSIESSGTSGLRKRIFFTAEDQGLALDFFAGGVAAMAAAGDRMFIALPGEREGSVGFQLARGIARAGVVPIPHGLVVDPAAALRRMDEERATLLIGLPTQVLALTLERGDLARRVFRRLHTIVLCSDHIPQSLAERIRCSTGCRIYEHYGSTEMGLGGGIDCLAHTGYHLREADLYFEIGSPQTGLPLPEGEPGEVVFTTLNRTGMPLIRYRTGDLSRFVPGPCDCGSPLRRLERVRGRTGNAVRLGPSGAITIADLDEILFAIPAVHDFTAALAPGSPRQLLVRLCAPHEPEAAVDEAERALHMQPAIRSACAAGVLWLGVSSQRLPFPAAGAKRTIGSSAPISGSASK
ncbi:MAG: DVU_1553 family AMP-dependent CoA ligase [Terracidiphilus sp.]